MIKRDQSLATPYLQFDRTQWAALRDSVPLTLSEEEIVKLKGINEDLSLEEVAQIYLPLSRLLNFYISSNLRRQAVLEQFLGTDGQKIPYVIGIAGSVAVGKSTTAVLTWTDSLIATAFTLQKASDASFTTDQVTIPLGKTLTYSDRIGTNVMPIYYRVSATNTVGSEVPGYPTITAESKFSNSWGVNLIVPTAPTILSATLRGRWISERPTVETNPVRKVDSYAVLDLALTAQDLWSSGLGISLSINNLTNTGYFHPGTREASAGIDPGAFDEDGQWHGSRGFFNSLLPQPGRSFHVMLRFDY